MTKDWVQGVGHSPVCQIFLQIVVRAVITSFLPAWTSSAGVLSTPAFHVPVVFRVWPDRRLSLTNVSKCLLRLTYFGLVNNL